MISPEGTGNVIPFNVHAQAREAIREQNRIVTAGEEIESIHDEEQIIAAALRRIALTMHRTSSVSVQQEGLASINRSSRLAESYAPRPTVVENARLLGRRIFTKIPEPRNDE